MAGARSIPASCGFDPSPRNAMGQVRDHWSRCWPRSKDRSRSSSLPHDNPDPDVREPRLCSTSCASWRTLDDHRPAASSARREPARLVRVHHIGLTPVKDIGDTAETQVALVDTQPGREQQLCRPTSKRPVIDHHPAYSDQREHPVRGPARPGTGATSTILTEYLRDSHVTIESKIATALFTASPPRRRTSDASPRPPTSRRATSCTRTRTSAAWEDRERARAARVLPDVPRRDRGRGLRQGRDLGPGDVLYPTWSRRSPASGCASTRSTGRRYGCYKKNPARPLRTTDREANAEEIPQKVLGSRSAGGHDMIAGGKIHIDGKRPRARRSRCASAVHAADRRRRRNPGIWFRHAQAVTLALGRLCRDLVAAVEWRIAGVSFAGDARRRPLESAHAARGRGPAASRGRGVPWRGTAQVRAVLPRTTAALPREAFAAGVGEGGVAITDSGIRTRPVRGTDAGRVRDGRRRARGVAVPRAGDLAGHSRKPLAERRAETGGDRAPVLDRRVRDAAPRDRAGSRARWHRSDTRRCSACMCRSGRAPARPARARRRPGSRRGTRTSRDPAERQRVLAGPADARPRGPLVLEDRRGVDEAGRAHARQQALDRAPQRSSRSPISWW